MPTLPGRAVHEHRLARLHLRRTVEQLVRRHVGEHEAQDLRRIEVLRHLDGAGLRHAHALRVGTPHRQRADTVSDAQPCGARAQLLDNTDELVAGRERRIRHAEIGPGAQHGIGIGHARGQHPDPDLARTRSGIVLLNHLQDLGTAEVIDDDTLHRSHLLVRPAPPPGRCSCRFLLIRLACSDR